MLEVFDLPPMSPNCIERSYSTVSTQALEMMNSELIRERARYWAGRLIDEFGLTHEAARTKLDRKPRMKKATFRVPHRDVVGTAANLALELAQGGRG